MDLLRFLAIALVPLVGACAARQTGTVVPELLLTIDGTARDFTIDEAGNFYVFDYEEYVIRKFDPHGGLVAAFGGTGQEPGRFSHLMAIQVHGDSLLALDAGSISVFELSGQFRARRVFSDTIYSDFPRVSPDGRWLGGWLVPETAEHALTYRTSNGTEIARLASYPLSDVFPEIEPGEPFFVNSVQAPSYLYDFRPAGQTLWMVSDRLRIFGHHGSQTDVLVELEATPVPYPADEITLLQQRQARLQPPLHINVPEFYQLAHHLLVAESGDVWLYMLSQERTGLLHLCVRQRGGVDIQLETSMRSDGSYTLKLPCRWETLEGRSEPCCSIV